eukprot:GHVL01042331.1.p1 GENE.GHVL01042331.1~~GHVL01042331.1.p1  ORF type:complete len:607 (+),score=56.62 GHVL01042331.1:128-1948(+)
MNAHRWNAVLLFGCVSLIGILSLGKGEIMFIAERLPLKGDRALSDVPWPMPEKWSRNNDTFTVLPSSLKFDFNTECDIIDDAIRRYRDVIGLFKHDASADDSDITNVEISLGNGTCEKFPYLDMDETYTLVTEMDKVVISCNTVWGALRGLETFSQLLFEESGKVWMRNWTISDKPRFSHRGFMIDTSRHYLPLSIIKKHLDAMAWSKMNVLHWHIVDAQSFPFVSTTFPELSDKGSFTPRHVYKPEDVAEVIEHARLRGIRVIPEFDTPGHTHSWGKGKPELLTPCWNDGQPMRAKYGEYNKAENFDPTRDVTFTFLQQLMSEVNDVFKDEFIHAGMDEAHYMCWQSSPNITEFMEEKGFNGSYAKLEEYYVSRALDVIGGTGKNVIMWQDPIDNGVTVNKSAIVEVWKNNRSNIDCAQNSVDMWQEFASQVAKSGNRMILSSCWYLNYLCYGEDWRRFYACDPHNFTEEQLEKDLVVGGEACLWGEFVDGTNFLQRSWPRAAAAAERLWSPSHVTDANTAAFRLDAHRCRLLRRGVPAQPVLPGYCGDYDYGFEPETPSTPHTTGPPATSEPCGTNGADTDRVRFAVTTKVVIVLLSLLIATIP